MTKEERRLNQLEGQYLAHQVVLRSIILSLYRDPVELRERREMLCNLVEELMENEVVDDHGNLVLHNALTAIESLFAPTDEGFIRPDAPGAGR